MSAEKAYYDMMNLQSALSKIQNESGRNNKEALLRRFEDVPYFKETMGFLYNNLIVTGISKAKLADERGQKAVEGYTQIKDYSELLNYLSKNSTGRLVDLSSVNSFITNFEGSERKMLEGIITKDIPLGLSGTTLNKVYGKGFVPKFDVMKGTKFDPTKHTKDGSLPVTHAITEKMDGCFDGNTKVLMADSSYKKIKQIKKGDEVLSFNENTRKIEPNKVTNVFDNGLKPIEEWSVIQTYTHLNSSKEKVITTKNHLFFTPEGWKKAGEIKLGDVVYTYDYSPTNEEQQVLMGMGMGDTNVVKDNASSPTVRYVMSRTKKSPHDEYFNILKKFFKEKYGSTMNRVSGYGSQILAGSIKTIKTLPKEFYDTENIRKSSYKINENTLKFFTPLTLAVYYLDDGSLIKGQEDDSEKSKNVKPTAMLHMDRLPLEEIEQFQNFLLNQFDIKTTIRKSKVKVDNSQSYSLYVTSQGTEKMFDLIAPYIPRCMRYKLGQKWHSIPENKWWIKTESSLGLTPTVITEVSHDPTTIPSIRAKKKRAYDIEVENNHTYFANNFAVHNCRAITLIDHKGQVTLMARSGKEHVGYTELIEDIKALEYKNVVFDGEILAKNPNGLKSDELFSVTSSITRKKGEKTGLNYWIYDTLSYDEFLEGKSGSPYELRRGDLSIVEDKIAKTGLLHLHISPVLAWTKNMDVVQKYIDFAAEEGKEGIMLNSASGFYTTTRTKQLLKVKQFHTADVLCTDVVEEIRGGKLGAIVVDYKGSEVKVGSGFSAEERQRFWDSPDEIIGKIVEIQYFEESRNQKDDSISLRFPTFKRVRQKDEVSYH